MRRGLIFLFCMILVFAFTLRSEGMDEKGKWSLGLNVGYYLPEFSGQYEYNDVYLTNIEGFLEASDELSFGINFNYRMTDRAFFQLLLERYKGDLDFDFSGVDSSENVAVHFESNELSELSILPLSLDMGWSFIKGDNYDIYALFGSTYFYSTNHIYRPSEYNQYNIQYPEDNDSTIGFNIGGGGNFFFTKRYAANFDLRYYWGEADFDTEYDYDLGGFRSSLGLKIVLGSLAE